MTPVTLRWLLLAFACTFLGVLAIAGEFAVLSTLLFFAVGWSLGQAIRELMR